MDKSIIYVLRLHNNKYFINKTNCLNKTWSKYFFDKNYSLEWIHKNKPIDIEQIYNSNGNLDNYIYKYMSKYSIENVRGGSFTDLILTDKTIKNIKSILKPQPLKNNSKIEFYQYYNKNTNLYKNIFYKKNIQ
tara:strand:- start:3503 stop:3901 length:399 start_codon:yes stop_codon:yes gene_type:complete